MTKREKQRGWVEFYCPEHGFLVATKGIAVVICNRKHKTKKPKRATKRKGA